MSIPCGTCLSGPGCLPTNDLNLMSLDSSVFHFIPNCPDGRDCFGPSIGGGTISFPVCNQVLSRTLPAGLSQDEWLQIIGEMLAQAAQLSQFCGGGGPIDPGTPVLLYFNHPQSCSAYCSDGLPFTVTIPAGRVIAFSQTLADAQASAQACSQAASRKICLSTLPQAFCVGSAVNLKIQATGNSLAVFPFSDFWEMVDGLLPSGLTFNGGYLTGGQATITGTPTEDGFFAFTIRVTNPDGDFQQKTYGMCFITITPASFPIITVGVPVSVQLRASDCAVGPLSWQIVAGALPPGLTLNEQTGLISGTPTADYTSFTVRLQTEST